MSGPYVVTDNMHEFYNSTLVIANSIAEMVLGTLQEIKTNEAKIS